MPAPQLQSRTPTAVGSNGRPQCQHLKGEVGNVSGLVQGSATSRPHKTSHRERTGRQNPEPQRKSPTFHTPSCPWHSPCGRGSTLQSLLNLASFILLLSGDLAHRQGHPQWLFFLVERPGPLGKPGLQEDETTDVEETDSLELGSSQ